MDGSERFKDVTEAWDWLRSHPTFDYGVTEAVLSPEEPAARALGITEEVRYQLHDNTFAESLDIEMAMVNPQTARVDDDAALNTQLWVWLEAGGPVESDGVRYRVSHDPSLDCGAPSFEEAVLLMADKVLKEYGDYQPGEYDI